MPIAAAALGCAVYLPANVHLEQFDPTDGYRIEQPLVSERSDELLLLVAFSGGGTRAAAFAYGALEALRDAKVEIGGRTRRLLDEVDLVSAVSGGSFPAAYWALHGDRVFEDFEERFLRRNVQLRMVGQLFDPRNWPRLLSSYFDRTELAARWFDRRLFDGATFEDLERPGAPRLLINATDLSRGVRFGFEQRQFDWICSDLRRFKVARAVTASSAVPVLLSSVILRNHAGSCVFEPPAWVTRAQADPRASRREQFHASRRASYLDASTRRYVHLVDGGLADNLGLRAFVDAVLAEGRAGRERILAGHERVREIAVVVVNAQTEPGGRLDVLDWAPPLAVMLDAMTSTQVNLYNFETLELLQVAFEALARELSTPARPVHFRLVEISFAGLDDPEERRTLERLPTSLALGDAEVAHLRDAARRLLRMNPEFQALLAAPLG